MKLLNSDPTKGYIKKAICCFLKTEWRADKLYEVIERYFNDLRNQNIISSFDDLCVTTSFKINRPRITDVLCVVFIDDIEYKVKVHYEDVINYRNY